MTADLSRAWGATAVFDKPVEMRNGYAVLGPRTLESVWSDLLSDLMPATIAPVKRMTRSEAEKWLFAPQAGRLRRPSTFMTDYRKHEDIIRVLIAGRDSGLWKLDTRLRQYKTFEDAYRNENLRWIKFGYKDEIDSAIKVIDAEQNTKKWRNWLRLQNAYEAFRVPIDYTRSIPQTIILPPPGTWADSTAWSRASALSLSGVRVNFQVAKIKLFRPWLDFDFLIDNPDLFVGDNRNREAIVSDGVQPSAINFPSGSASAMVDELILVKQIRFESDATTILNHPLRSYAYPEAVNILGYVVRTLPKLPP
ncbi:hypothetical protein [Methylocystis sp. Sn-Cys]|uniref:hypothetical protein n=1 Tax=Methylocystis sp. Sn-Cys TaxID=1701263 RepID=UPI001922E901|nr:hypothetical protein [Methylocystis sp. Sn-Cys]MBL1255964.1 hypothetical protein [Methylocystis sp. Sn-Cys]